MKCNQKYYKNCYFFIFNLKDIRKQFRIIFPLIYLFPFITSTYIFLSIFSGKLNRISLKGFEKHQNRVKTLPFLSVVRPQKCVANIHQREKKKLMIFVSVNNNISLPIYVHRYETQTEPIYTISHKSRCLRQLFFSLHEKIPEKNEIKLRNKG